MPGSVVGNSSCCVHSFYALTQKYTMGVSSVFTMMIRANLTHMPT